MDATESELQEALTDAIIEGNTVAAGLARMALARLAAGGKLNGAKASERGINMQVLGTVGNIDPTAICQDPNCKQKGEMYKDHVVSHRPLTKKGMRGVCPHCKGALHNTNDAAQLIAFQCLWRQAFGDRAKKVAVTANSLHEVGHLISNGAITGWADRSALHTILAAPKAAPGPTSTGTAPATSAPPTPIGVTPLHAAPPSAPSTVQPGAAPAATDEDKAERKKKLAAALKGARVTP